MLSEWSSSRLSALADLAPGASQRREAPRSSTGALAVAGTVAESVAESAADTRGGAAREARPAGVKEVGVKGVGVKGVGVKEVGGGALAPNSATVVEP